ncbi:MAG TPA: hypothetical protein ENJ95_16575 [Bacteroidetes bacterium]|nr:hypothetical protein [Bacteroidota bacterium]
MKNIYKIQLIILLCLALSSCSVIGVLQSHKEVKGDYITELVPIDKDPVYDMSINVIQGIASFENGWFTSQTSKSRFLLINYLNEKGESVFHKRLLINSHGQDLSLEQVSENKLYLYTTAGHFDEENVSYMVRIVVDLPEKINGKRDMSKLQINLDEKYPLNLTNCTPTLSEDKKHFAIRSANSIIVATKEDVLKNDLSNATKFNLDASQLIGKNNEPLWFQGIAMKDGLIYCMTGNNSIGSIKLLYVYNLKGEVVQKHVIDKDKFAMQLKKKLEPEGITFKDGDLYYTIMLKGGTGGNRKFLFKYR